MTGPGDVAGGGDATGWGPIDDDLVGTASARLLASGTARGDRLAALNLLGLLVDHADADDIVRLPLRMLAGEFGVPLERGNALLQLLVAVEVVHDAGDGVMVGCSSPPNAGGLRLSRYLTNVATVLDVNAQGDDLSLPRAPRRAGRRGQRQRIDRKALPRVLAGAAAAVVVMWASAASSGVPTSVHTLAGEASPTGRAPWATTPTPSTAPGPGSSPADAPDPFPGGTPSPPGPESVELPDASSPPVVDPAKPAPGRSSDPRVSDDNGSRRPSLTPGPSSPGPARSRSGSAPLPRRHEPSVSPPVTVNAPGDGGSSCPSGAPAASVVESRLLPGVARGLFEVVGEPDAEVHGTMTNPTEADLVVRAFEIGVDAGIPGAPAPLVVRAGEVVRWRVELPSGTALPVPSTVEVQILDWSWSDPVLDALCPS